MTRNEKIMAVVRKSTYTPVTKPELERLAGVCSYNHKCWSELLERNCMEITYNYYTKMLYKNVKTIVKTYPTREELLEYTDIEGRRNEHSVPKNISIKKFIDSIPFITPGTPKTRAWKDGTDQLGTHGCDSVFRWCKENHLIKMIGTEIYPMV